MFTRRILILLTFFRIAIIICPPPETLSEAIDAKTLLKNVQSAGSRESGISKDASVFTHQKLPEERTKISVDAPATRVDEERGFKSEESAAEKKASTAAFSTKTDKRTDLSFEPSFLNLLEQGGLDYLVELSKAREMMAEGWGKELEGFSKPEAEAPGFWQRTGRRVRVQMQHLLAFLARIFGFRRHSTQYERLAAERQAVIDALTKAFELEKSLAKRFIERRLTPETLVEMKHEIEGMNQMLQDAARHQENAYSAGDGKIEVKKIAGYEEVTRLNKDAQEALGMRLKS